MARIGYMDAKNDVSSARRNYSYCETMLKDVVSQPEYAKDIYRSDWTKQLELARIEQERAEQAFAVYDIKPSANNREYFDVQVQMFVSLKSETHEAMKVRMLDDGITKAELIRRALIAYLKA